MNFLCLFRQLCSSFDVFRTTKYVATAQIVHLHHIEQYVSLHYCLRVCVSTDNLTHSDEYARNDLIIYFTFFWQFSSYILGPNNLRALTELGISHNRNENCAAICNVWWSVCVGIGMRVCEYVELNKVLVVVDAQWNNLKQIEKFIDIFSPLLAPLLELVLVSKSLPRFYCKCVSNHFRPAPARSSSSSRCTCVEIVYVSFSFANTISLDSCNYA